MSCSLERPLSASSVQTGWRISAKLQKKKKNPCGFKVQAAADEFFQIVMLGIGSLLWVSL